MQSLFFLSFSSFFSISFFLSMPLYLFSLSRSSSLFLFFQSPPSTHTSALYPPYASLSFLSFLFFSSLFFHPHPYIGLIFTLCLSIFSLSLVLLLSFFSLNLRSYGQLFVLVFVEFRCDQLEPGNKHNL